MHYNLQSFLIGGDKLDGLVPTPWKMALTDFKFFFTNSLQPTCVFSYKIVSRNIHTNSLSSETRKRYFQQGYNINQDKFMASDLIL